MRGQWKPRIENRNELFQLYFRWVHWPHWGSGSKRKERANPTWTQVLPVSFPSGVKSREGNLHSTLDLFFMSKPCGSCVWLFGNYFDYIVALGNWENVSAVGSWNSYMGNGKRTLKYEMGEHRDSTGIKVLLLNVTNSDLIPGTA